MSENVSRIKSICDEFDGRVETVGAYHARAEIAKALADTETLLIERGEQCANLHAENARLVSELEELAKSVESLKSMLSTDGDYALCRSDHKLMGLGEELMIGDVIERIDKALTAQSEKENKNDK